MHTEVCTNSTFPSHIIASVLAFRLYGIHEGINNKRVQLMVKSSQKNLSVALW